MKIRELERVFIAAHNFAVMNNRQSVLEKMQTDPATVLSELLDLAICDDTKPGARILLKAEYHFAQETYRDFNHRTIHNDWLNAKHKKDMEDGNADDPDWDERLGWDEEGNHLVKEN